AVSNNPALVPNPVIIGTAAARTLRFTPATNLNGTATITVTAQNVGSSAAFKRTFVIDVLPVNDAPTFDPIANRTVAAGTATDLTITGVDSPAYDLGQTVVLTAVSS